MELTLRGKFTRDEQLYLTVGPFIRRWMIYYLKYSLVLIFLLAAMFIARRGVTVEAFCEILLLSGFFVAFLAILLLFRVARIRHATEDQEHETKLTLTPQMVTLETLGVTQSVPVSQLSIQNDRHGIIATVKSSGGLLVEGGVLFFVPERSLSHDDREKLNAMYGLVPPTTFMESK